ncbi:MAG: sodium/glutamate symporter [Lachnospiraceae bacterium]|nr:sodium/glutamate symporter [Lachnospiraceae bacterium]
MTIELNMYQTLAMAVIVLVFGTFLKHRIKFLEKFCIPSPVIGGIIFAILTCVCYSTGIAEFVFDDTLREVCMVFFFTSVGFQANLKVIKSGGKSLIIFLVLLISMIILQNLLALGLSNVLHINPLIGLCTGSIPMVGGHGTAGAFGPVLESLNVSGATTICTASATFGLIAGSLIGGPLGRRLIEKKDLLATAVPEDDSLLVEDEKRHERHTNMYASAVFQLIIAIGIGTVFSMLLTKTGMTFPIYIGAMLAAALIRNIAEYTGKVAIHMGEINDLGGIALSLFLGMAMITLKLWELASLALPMLILLGAQVLFMAVFTYFIEFNVMGRDYDAAVLVAGTCGFGMGATPNAMANMQAICNRYVPSVKAYLIIPLVGSLFADFINSLVITFFVNIL